MDMYLNRLRKEQKKRVRFNIVEDNARFHGSKEVDRWAPIDRRLSLRRHHSQPTLRNRYDKESKATMRWSTESSTCAAPLKCPKRIHSSPGGDRWRVSRNNSDSLIHSPPKRRFTSPSSPMLMLSSLNCKNLLSKKSEDDLPFSPPLQTSEVILDEALWELKGDRESQSDNTTKSEADGSSNLGETDESIPLVQRRKPRSTQQSLQHDEESNSTKLKSFFGLLNLMFLWSLWNAISQYISTIISRYNKNDSSSALISKEEQKMERMEQGEEAIPFAMSRTPNSPKSPYSLSVL